MEMISKYGTNRENHPSFDGAAWYVASGGVTKGRVYGAPRMPKFIVSTSSSSHSYWWSHHILVHRIGHCKRRYRIKKRR